MLASSLLSNIFTTNGFPVFLFILLLTLCIVYISRLLVEKQSYPPGPIPWPLIGHAYSLFKNNPGAYRYNNWRKYGNVVSWYIPVTNGWRVDLFGYDAIYEAFVTKGEKFSERPAGFVTDLIGEGIIFSQNGKWKGMRNHAISVFREKGMGKASMEEFITEEIEFLIGALDKFEGRVLSSREFQRFICMAVSNLTNRMVFGRRIDYDDKMAECLMSYPHYFLCYFRLRTLPFLKWFVDYETPRLQFEQAKAYFRSEIDRHKASFDPNNLKDYIDSFLDKGMKDEDPTFKDEGRLLASIMELYVAGAETTAVTLLWSILYMVNHEGVQNKVYEEVLQLLGSRRVVLSDRDSLPYTQAVLHEVFRVSTIATGNLPHMCTEDTVIAGQLIKKGTIIHGNLWSISHDVTLYPDPDTFNPDRFLDDNGQFKPPSGPAMLPFSIGRRSCPGDTFAKAMFFMFFVSLIQTYQFKRPSSEKFSEEGKLRFTYECKPYEFEMTSR